MSLEEILSYVQKKYCISPDYPWKSAPSNGILRHRHNRKWFAAVLMVTEEKLGLDGTKLIDILNLKCNPLMAGSLINNQTIFPAWHMNKEHWITISLNSIISRETVFNLIDLSYELTK